MDSNQMDVDAILMALGPYGRYQVLQFSYLLFCLLPISYPVLISAFIGHAPPFQCKNLTEPISQYIHHISNMSIPEVSYGTCDVTVHNVSINAMNPTDITLKCPEGYTFDVEKDETIISEWNLVCSRQGLSETSTTGVLLGQMIGAAIFTQLADRFGRKPISLITHIAMMLGNIGVAFIPTFSGFFVLRLLIGAFQQGVGLAQATIFIEIFPKEARGRMLFIGSIAWACSVLMISVVAYFLRYVSWRYLQLVGGLLSFHSLFAYWTQCESLRWLVVNKKYDEVKQWIRLAARINRKDGEEIIRKFFPNSEENVTKEGHALLNSSENNVIATVNKDDSKESTKPNHEKSTIDEMTIESSHGIEKLTCLDIFKRKMLLRNSLIIWFAWITDGMTYYGLFLTAHTLPGNRYLNFALSSLAEIPGNILFYIMVDRWGRKTTTVVMHAITGFSLILSVSLLTIKGNSAASVTSIVLNFVGKIGISGAFNVIFLYTPELYPTNLRNVGFGAASAAARIGGMVSPYAAMLATHAIWGPGVIFGSACIVITFLSLFLPETMGRELPQSVAEMKSWRYTKPQKLSRKK